MHSGQILGVQNRGMVRTNCCLGARRVLGYVQLMGALSLAVLKTIDVQGAWCVQKAGAQEAMAPPEPVCV